MPVLLQKNITSATVAVFFAAVFYVLPFLAQAADLSLSPATGSVGIGETISVQVTLNPFSESVNAADGTISFDKNILSVENVSKDGSAFSLWTSDPTYSNAAGTVEFSGGSPAGFTVQKKIITIVFKGKAAGSAKISFAKGSVLAADGKGTDVYKTGNGATIAVANIAPKEIEESEPAASTSDSETETATPLAPIIASLSHPKPESWYGTSTVVFSWQLYSDITSIRTLLSDKDNDIPKIALKGRATTTVTVEGAKDGVSYFYAQFKNEAGWGEVGKIKIQVDTVPPTEFDVSLQEAGESGVAKFAFKSEDVLSGMDRYEIAISTSTPVVIKAQDVSDGTYPVPPQGGGEKEVTIRAYDKAGNVRAVTKTLTLPAVVKASSKAVAEEVPPPVSPWGFQLFFILFLMAAISAMIAWTMYGRKIAQKEKVELLRMVVELRDKNDRIFSAMREEFEQMVNNLNKKPQLTPEERNLLEEIKEVLDFSEEIVDTGLEDLKKKVRGQ